MTAGATYPVAELIDLDRLMEVLDRSVVRARELREEWQQEYHAHCRCWEVGACCEWCEANT